MFLVAFMIIYIWGKLMTFIWDKLVEPIAARWGYKPVPPPSKVIGSAIMQSSGQGEEKVQLELKKEK